jgi:protease IV
MRRFLTTLFTLAVVVPSARAQDGGPYSATFDMHLPPASVASCPGPLALTFNPAALAWAPSFDLLFVHQQRLDVGQSSGDQVFVGGADGLLLNIKHLGLGLQWVRPYDDEDRWNYLKYTIAFPLITQGRIFSMAAGIEILDPTDTDEDPSVDYVLGAMVRPLRYLSIGVTGRNLGRAKINQQRSDRSLNIGIAIRPLWFAPERVTLTADYGLVQENDDPPLRFTGRFSVIDGLTLFGSADLDGNFGAGLMIDFQRVGAGSYLGVSNTDELEPSNVLLMARVSAENHPGFIVSHEKTAEFTLDNELIAGQPTAVGIFTRRVTAFDIQSSIRRAATDQRIDSLLLKVEDPDLNWTEVQELRDALADFKKTGKKVVFHLRDADNLSYYLASSGDAIFLDPGGSFNVTGPTVEALFLGGTMELIGARAEYKRIGKYKSAVETLTAEEPSEPAREVMNSLADEYADQLIEAIASSRDISREKVKQLIDKGFMVPEKAKQEDLVDDLVYFDQVDSAIAKVTGHSSRRVGGYIAQRWYNDRWGSRPVIAVVNASGLIAYRESLATGMDAHRIAMLLSWLRDNSSVDAVVLRVDSSGGSGSASDLIWRQVKRLAEKKPVVVSMGGVAASGGYYISAAADTIVADPATITGSIGVFVLFFDLSELWAKLGISKEIVKRGKLADLGSTFRARTEEEMKLLGETTKSFYKGFIDRVAEGRHKTPEEIDAVGQGRVWTGRQAKEKGLVDELGGLARAIEVAKQKIGLDPDQVVDVVHLPRPSLSLRVLLGEIGIMSETADPVPDVIRKTLNEIVELSALNSEPFLMMLPYRLEIK